MNNDDVDDINNIYRTKSAGKYIPSVEQEFLDKCKIQKTDVVSRYFSKPPQQQQIVEQQKAQIPSQPNNSQILNEVKQRNNFLNEAIISLQKVSTLLNDKRDRAYLKEIREAIEELMG